MERYGYEFETEFEIESYLKYNGNNFTRRFDANSYLYVTKAMDYFDLSQPTGSLAAAFVDSAHIKFLVVSFTSDWLYPSYHSKDLVSALTAVGADVSYLDIQSTWGHDAFLLEVETMTKLLGSFLDRLASEEGIAAADAGPDSVTEDGGRHLIAERVPAPSAIAATASRPAHAIADMIHAASKVLDLGCGDGALLAFLREQQASSRARHRAERGRRAGLCAARSERAPGQPAGRPGGLSEWFDGLCGPEPDVAVFG